LLRLATHLLANPASSDEVRQRAAELVQSARAHLSPDEATRIEAASNAQSLAATLAELELPTRAP